MAADFARQKTFCRGEEKMVPNALQAVSAYVIPPLLGFIVLLGLALISLLRGGRKRTNILFAGICFLGALLNADVALVSILPDERLALRVDRTVHFFFVFSIPIYIRFVHAFLGIRGRRWLEIPAWLFSIAFLTIVPTDLYFNGFHHYSFGRIARAGVLFHLFSATVAFTVIYCLAVLYRAMKESADNHQRNRIKYIFGGLGFSALLLAFTILPVSGVPVYPLGNFSFIPAVFLAFGVLKYDLLDIGALIRRGTVYFLLTGILTGALYPRHLSLPHLFSQHRQRRFVCAFSGPGAHHRPLVHPPSGTGAEPHRPPFFPGTLRLPGAAPGDQRAVGLASESPADQGTAHRRDYGGPAGGEGDPHPCRRGCFPSLRRKRNGRGRGGVYPERFLR